MSDIIKINPVEKVVFVDEYLIRIISSYNYYLSPYDCFSNNYFENINKDVYFLFNGAKLSDLFFKDGPNVLIFALENIRTTTNVSMDEQTIYFDLSYTYFELSLKKLLNGKLLHPSIIVENINDKSSSNKFLHMTIIIEVEDLEITRRKKIQKIINSNGNNT